MKPKTFLNLSSDITKKRKEKKNHMGYFPGIVKKGAQIWGNYTLPASVILCCFSCLSVSLLCWIVANTLHSQVGQKNIHYSNFYRGKNFITLIQQTERQLLQNWRPNLFIQQIFMKHLLCARFCIFSEEQNRYSYLFPQKQSLVR